MFLKKLFKKNENPESPRDEHEKTKLPAGHPTNANLKDASMCPFMASKSAQKQKEKEQPRGGCPFMNSSDDQKNPGLQLYHQAYDEEHVSKFRYYLSRSKIDINFFEKGTKRRNRCRDLLESYPIYLQHTLFYHSEDLVKIRGFECCSRFMAYEELREKGNKKYHEKDYYGALDFYERAMSLYKWLEHKEPEQEPEPEAVPSSVEIVSKTEIEVSESEASRSNIEFDLPSMTNLNQENSKEKQAEINQQRDELRTKYKEFFVYYCDENVVLHDGEEMTETPDIDMRKSLLIQIYLNMACAYMMLNHYSLAQRCVKDAEEQSPKVSSVFLRKAQALALNKSATLEQLEEAKKAIEYAIAARPTEKIYNNVNKNILKMLNLHDAEQAYQKCLEVVEQRIVETKEALNQRIERVANRMKEIHQVEQEIISSGREPIERNNGLTAFQSTDYRIILRMKDKYLRVVDFYTESNKPDQVALAKTELQEVLQVINTMKIINSISMQDLPADMEIGDRESEKLLKRIEKVKIDHSEQVYNKGKYNFQVLEWAIKEIVDEDMKKEEQLKKEKEEEAKRMRAEQGIVESVKGTNPARYLWLLLILPLLAILASRFLGNGLF